MFNSARKVISQHSGRPERTNQSAGKCTPIRRFPRVDERLEFLAQELQASCSDPERLLHLVKQMEAHVELTYGKGQLRDCSTWRDIPRFDPSLVPRTRWIVDRFVAQGNVQLVYGERGSFKTCLLLLAAKAVSTGTRFLGMKTRKRRVVYIDYENPANVLKSRNDDLGLNLPFNKNLVIWNRFGTQPPPKPGDPVLEAIVGDCIAETGLAPWLIFDSWSSLLKPGEGGELTGQIAPIYLDIRKLADLGAAITIIDHTKKNDRGTLYGGQDKEAKVDSIHKLVHVSNKFQPNNQIICVQSWLKRAAPEGEGSFAFEVQSRQDSKGNWHIVGLVPAQDPEEARAQEEIQLLRNLIRQNPNSGQEELAKLAAKQGIPREQAIKLLKDGVEKYWQARKTSHNKFSYSLA
jgi:hypothetical protein